MRYQKTSVRTRLRLRNWSNMEQKRRNCRNASTISKKSLAVFFFFLHLPLFLFLFFLPLSFCSQTECTWWSRFLLSFLDREVENWMTEKIYRLDESLVVSDNVVILLFFRIFSNHTITTITSPPLLSSWPSCLSKYK